MSARGGWPSEKGELEMSKEILLALAVLGSQEPAPRSERPQLAVTCFQTGEQSSGMNKICYYDCLGSQAAITVSSVQLCPLTINR
jgi:hypothetical protein